METITCIFCNGSDRDPVVMVENGYTGKQCSNCGLIYISPRPSFEDITYRYKCDEAHISAGSHIEDSRVKRRYSRYTLSVLLRFIKGGDLLEIGAGAGYFLREAVKAGFQSHGLELNPIQAKFINDLGFPCETKSLTDSYPGHSFDVIYHCDVLSHFFDPIAEFKTMNQRLVPGGILLFETGNFGDVEKRFYDTIPRFQYPDHLFFFSERNIQEILRRTGFELLEIKRFSILWQYKLMKFIRSLSQAIKRTMRPGKGSAEFRPTPAKVGKRKTTLHHVIDYVMFLVRYMMGAVLPKRGRPQTVIVVARKTS